MYTCPEHGHNTRVAVIGAGSWGRHWPISWRPKDMRSGSGLVPSAWPSVWPVNEKTALYLPGVPLHPRLTSTADFAEAAYARPAFISVVPSHAVRTVWSMLAPMLPASALLVSATKGIEAGSLYTMSQVLQATLAPQAGH